MDTGWREYAFNRVYLLPTLAKPSASTRDLGECGWLGDRETL